MFKKTFAAVISVFYFTIFTFLLVSLYDGGSLLYGFSLHKNDSQVQTSKMDICDLGLSEDKTFFRTILSKKIFKPAEYRDYKKTENVAPGEKNPIKGFRLVGIMQDEAPKAIVEDDNASKTYYLRVNDSFCGMEVVSIDEGRIILESSEARYSLAI